MRDELDSLWREIAAYVTSFHRQFRQDWVRKAVDCSPELCRFFDAHGELRAWLEQLPRKVPPDLRNSWPKCGLDLTRSLLARLSLNLSDYLRCSTECRSIKGILTHWARLRAPEIGWRDGLK